jgi:hypothetical protein
MRKTKDSFHLLEIQWRSSAVDELLIHLVHRRAAPIEQGIPPSDPERASCRNQMALLTRLTSAQTDPYSVDGFTLGSKMAYGNPAYQQYHCVPSQKFEGFVRCTKTISDKEARGRFKAAFSILRSSRSLSVPGSVQML